MQPFRFHHIAQFLVACFVILACLGNGKTSLAAPRATITVDSGADIVSRNFQCTLREAIQNANDNAQTNLDCAAGSGADLIIFGDRVGNITLSSSLPPIYDHLTIDGALSGIGERQTIDGASAYSIFDIGNYRVNLVNLILTQGSASSFGGAVDTYGDVTIYNCLFTDNQANQNGGAIHHQGTELVITNSTFSGNESKTGNGGAIFASNSTTIESSTFTNNQADLSGGAFSYMGTEDEASILDSSFTNNSAESGGAINHTRMMTVTHSTFSENSASGRGGAIHSNVSQNGTVLVVLNSTLFHNEAVNWGGALDIFDGKGSITNSTIYSNTAGIGGSAVFAGDPITFTHTTIMANSGPSAIYPYETTKVFMQNSIIANTNGVNCQATIQNLGYNLQYGGSDPDSCLSSIEIADPKLSELGDHGGKTETMMPLYNSPALNRIPAANGCGAGVLTDQRDVSRPRNLLCDIGAFEQDALVFLPLVVR